MNSLADIMKNEDIIVINQKLSVLKQINKTEEFDKLLKRYKRFVNSNKGIEGKLFKNPQLMLAYVYNGKAVSFMDTFSAQMIISYTPYYVPLITAQDKYLPSFVAYSVSQNHKLSDKITFAYVFYSNSN